MARPLHTGRLILTPEDPYAPPADLPVILERLRNIGCITDEIGGDSTRYRLGERFLQLVTFMGCSPFVELEPGEGDLPFCHLSILGPFDKPRLVCGRNTTPPRCTACRKRLNDWRDAIDQWRTGDVTSPRACPHCGHLQDPISYDWRESAGWGRFFLCLENIFPQEAIPTQELLSRLRSTASEPAWRYFYQQDAET